MNEICKITQSRIADGKSLTGGVVVTAATARGPREFLVKSREDGAACMRFDIDRVRIDADGGITLIEKRVKLAEERRADGGAMDIQKAQGRHLQTGRFTSDARTVYVNAMTQYINASSHFDDDVLAEAKKVAAQAVKASGLDIDDSITGGYPERQQQDMTGSPETPARKALTIDEVNGRLVKILASVTASGAAIREDILMKRANAGDGGALTGLLEKRLASDDRPAAPGWMSLLKADDAQSVDSCFGGTIAFAPVTSIRKADSGASDLAKRIKTVEELAERLAKSERRPMEFSALWGDSDRIGPRSSYNPMQSNLDPDSQSRERLVKALGARQTAGASSIADLLSD
jgi:hypothetical protein